MPTSALHRYKTSFCHPTHPSMILISFYLSAAWVSTICVLYSLFLSLLELLLVLTYMTMLECSILSVDVHVLYSVRNCCLLITLKCRYIIPNTDLALFAAAIHCLYGLRSWERFRVNSTRGQLDTCVKLTACRVDSCVELTLVKSTNGQLDTSRLMWKK